MIYEIYTENGTKKKRALTGNGYGLPLGTWISYEGTCPDGFIEAEQTFNTTTYAALYALLGTNKVPAKWEYSEPILLEENHASGNVIFPANFGIVGLSAVNTYFGVNANIDYCEMTKEVFLAKDFVVQYAAGYAVRLNSPTENLDGSFTSVYSSQTGGGIVTTADIYFKTRKHLAIKATPAYVEPDTVSDMVHTMRVQDSYSTEEVNTGKTWIDGKPIYRKVVADITPGTYASVSDDIETVTNLFWSAKSTNFTSSECYNWGSESSSVYSDVWRITASGANYNKFYCRGLGGIFSSGKMTLIVEYTKTTD